MGVFKLVVIVTRFIYVWNFYDSKLVETIAQYYDKFPLMIAVMSFVSLK